MEDSIVGYQKLTVSSTAVGFTLPSVREVTKALCKVEDASIRWRADGTDPTSSSGYPVDPGAAPFIIGGQNEDYSEIVNFRAIRVYSQDAAISIVFYGRKA